MYQSSLVKTSRGFSIYMVLERAHEGKKFYFRGNLCEFEVDLLTPKVGVFMEAYGSRFMVPRT